MIKVEFGALSEQGHVRSRNEDSIAHAVPTDPAVLQKKGLLFVVADGVGGHGAGDVASSEAVKTLEHAYYASHKSPLASLRTAFGQANLHVFDLGIKTNRHRMATTLSAITFVGTQYHIVHAGDSRIYRVRPNTQIEQLTQDHSEVAELVKMQVLSPDKVRDHPRRSMITRALGSQTVVAPMVRSGDVRADDYFILCTDGLWEPVQDVEIGQYALDNEPAEAVKLLVDLGLERQTVDNLSVLVIKVLAVEAQDGEHASETAGLLGHIWKIFGRRETNN
jgi:serine/threonine protein phosphatase PrpC